MGVDRNALVNCIYKETEEYQACKEKIERANWVPFLENSKDIVAPLLSPK
jgi:hypothetical protein